MTPEERAEAAQAVNDYRRAAVRMRRNDATPLDMQRSRYVQDARDANAHAMGDARRTLDHLGLPEVSSALTRTHEALRNIAYAKNEGRPHHHWTDQLNEAQRVIRNALGED